MKKVLAAIIAAGALVGYLETPAHADQYERWFNLHNDTNRVITQVFATHVGMTGWGVDVAPRFINPGDNDRLEPLARHQGYCRFDIKVVYAGSAEQTMWNVNLCTAIDIVVDGQRHWVD